MSDTGLHGSVYEQLRAYADKMDYGLIALKKPQRETVQQARREISELLREIASKESTDPVSRLVAVILKQELKTVSGRGIGLCESLARSLESHDPSKTELDQLEQIATVIDKECSDTLARIRGKR